MLQKLTVAQGNVSLQAGFSQPAFELLGPSSSLHENIFRRLQKHGLRLADIRPRRLSETLDDLSVEYSLLNYRLLLKVGLDRLEAETFDLSQVSIDDVLEPFQELAAGTLMTIPTLKFKTLSFTLQFHGASEDGKARELPHKFFKEAPPLSMGPLAGAGVIFNFGAFQDQLTSSIIIESSNVVVNGLFLRFFAAWDPTRVTIDALKTHIDAFLNTASAQLGLDLHGIR